MNNKKYWIDNLKGFGIILVVMGHVSQIATDFIFMFHMPLFFIISGYLFKVTDPKIYFLKKSGHLLLPYFIYLIPLLGVQMFFENKSFGEYLVRLFFGGRFLYKWVGVFWFVTCLFATQQIFNLVVTYFAKYLATIMIFFLTTAYLNYYFFNIATPWNVSACLYTCPLFYIGYLLRKYNFIEKLSIWIASISIFLLLFLCSRFPALSIDLKINDYGTLLISFVLSCLAVICFMHVFKSFNRITPLSYLGQASMAIMYLHQPIHYLSKDYLGVPSTLAIVVMCLVISYLFYVLVDKFTISRKYLLGG